MMNGNGSGSEEPVRRFGSKFTGPILYRIRPKTADSDLSGQALKTRPPNDNGKRRRRYFSPYARSLSSLVMSRVGPSKVRSRTIPTPFANHVRMTNGVGSGSCVSGSV